MNLIAISVVLGVTALSQPAPSNPAPSSTPVPANAGAPQAGDPYRVLRTFEVGGDGRWDYVAVDSDAHRLYVPRSTRVMVLDTETGASVGEIPDTAGVHGVALALALGKGFTSNGRSDNVTAFDLKTLKAIQTIATGKNPDAIIFEPMTKRVFAFDGGSSDATVINAQDCSVVGTIPLGGKPEFGAVDGKGKVFVNIEDTSELLRIDAATMKVEQRTPLAPGEEPSGLAIDAAHHRLFCVCSNQKMVVVDGETGRVLATPSIGKGVDGAAFDAASGCALSANGEGTMTVVSTSGDKPFSVIQTLKTAQGARTMVIDPKTRRIYMPTADFEAPAEPAKEGERRRPTMKAGSFKIVVIGP